MAQRLRDDANNVGPEAQQFREIVVDEVACLIDFVGNTKAVLNSLVHRDELRQKSTRDS